MTSGELLAIHTLTLSLQDCPVSCHRQGDVLRHLGMPEVCMNEHPQISRVNTMFCNDLIKKAVHLYLYLVPASCLNYASDPQHLTLLFAQLCHTSNQSNSLTSSTFSCFKNLSEYGDVPVTSSNQNLPVL